MADDPDELGSRLDRIEQLLRQRPETPPVPAGPPVRSARSIVSRVDDVWVAVTEGNERVAGGIEGAVGSIRADLAALAAAVATLSGTAPGTGGGGVGDTGGGECSGGDEGCGGEVPGWAASAEKDDDEGVHQRLNQIEEALAGIASRLEGLSAMSLAPPPPLPGPTDDVAVAAVVTALVERVVDEVGRLSRRVDGLARNLEASAARSAEDTLAQRVTRLREQFRR